MLSKAISNYYSKQIHTKLNGFSINSFYDKDCIFEYSVIGDSYKIYFSNLCNTLQLYKINSKVEMFKKEANLDTLICSYGCNEKSIEFCIDDIFNDIKFEDKMKNTDWNKYCLKSNYHQSDSDEFYLKVLDVKKTVPTGFTGSKELCFYNEPFGNQNIKMEQSYLRCSLVGSLYKVVEIPSKFKARQLTLFDFLDGVNDYDLSRI